jgi:disulfide bond formation protein DsbB
MISFIQNHTTQVISLLTLLSHLIFLTVLIVIALHAGSRYKLYHFVHKHILKLLFWALLAAVVGSLVYSNIVGYPPCELCWIQRIFLYPQLIIVFMAMRRDDKRIIDYLVPLSFIGAAVALFHSLVQWGFSPLGSAIGCVAVGGECAKIYVDAYSYITIPFMSFTVFVYIITMKLVYRHREKKLKNQFN